MSSIAQSLLLGVLVVSLTSHTIADDQPQQEMAATIETDNRAAPDFKQIDALVEQLGHQQLTRRVQAKKDLLKAGKTAIPSLAKAALSDERESIERSIDILGALAQSKDEETADAARVTLQMLTESKRPSTAERARSVLNKKEADGIRPFEGWDKAGNPFARGGQNRSVSVSNINGVRSIRIVENGRETLIEEVPGRGIRVKTEEEKPVELVAKNAADLKKRLPEIYKLYKLYTSGPGITPGFGQLGGFQFGSANAKGNANAGQGFSFNTTGQGQANLAILHQLKELKRRMANTPTMQQLLDQQIKAMTKTQ